MALKWCSQFATVVLVLVNCDTMITTHADVTENPIRVGVSKPGGLGVGGPGMIGHRRRQRQQQQRPPLNDESDVYQRSVALQNSLAAFGIDFTNVNHNGNNEDYGTSDDKNSTIRCLVFERISLPSKDGSRQWIADRNGRRTVLSLSLHLFELQITYSDGKRSTENRTGSVSILLLVVVYSVVKSK